jgi:hypothetical protein
MILLDHGCPLEILDPLRHKVARSMVGQQRSVTATWMLAAFAVAAVLAGISIGLRGSSEEGTLAALRLTARWSFLWFWVASTAGAWAALLGPRLRPAAARAREFGLAYAAAHLVHVAVVAWLYRIAAHPPGARTLEFFGVAVLFTYVLALLSFSRPAAWLPVRVSSAIRRIGVEYITLAFLVDFAAPPFSLTVPYAVSYVPFLALLFLGYAVRLAAAARRSVQRVKV